MSPNPSRDRVPYGPGPHDCHGVSQRSLTVAAPPGSMVYAGIIPIGGHLGKSHHFMSRTQGMCLLGQSHDRVIH